MRHALEYLVEVFNPQAHLFRVTLSILAPAPDGVSFSLPAWIPGSYMIREFSKNLVEVRARQRGQAVRLEKTDKHSWRSAPLDSTEPLLVESIVYAWDLSVRCAHLDQSHGFFNGTQMFFRVEGREDWPHRVEIRRPDGEAFKEWRLATTLPAAAQGRKGVDRSGFGFRLAESYDALIDHPVEMGCFERIVFEVKGVRHEVVITGLVKFDHERLRSDLQRACEAVSDIFGETLPFERYLFLVMVVGDGYGGLEHRDSTALLCSRNDLPAVGADKRDEAYRGFLGLCAHEYFHAWNVKRIKPAAFVPYRLDVENYTRLLWVFEGFTSYYDDFALVRAGLISAEEYLGVLAKTMTAVTRGSGRLKQSLADSSFDAWTKYYRQDENSPNAIVSYYQKGALVALGLDLVIRSRTDGKRSLDDVMRFLWQAYGDGVHGVPEDAMAGIIRQATGLDLRRMLTAWVERCEDVPLERLLKPFGVTLSRKTGTRIGGLGVRVRGENGVARLSHVLDGGTAQQAGLSAGDELVAINGVRVTYTNLEALLGREEIGAFVEVAAFRRDELRVFSVRLDAPLLDEYVISVVDSRRSASSSSRRDWLSEKSPAS